MFDSNARSVVVRDDQGYGIWRLDDLEDGEPIERCPVDDDGYERAAERWRVLTRTHRGDWGRWLPRLKWLVLVSAIMWALSGVVLGALLFEHSNFDQPGLFGSLYKWSQVANATAQPLTIGGFALYVILWLEGRRRS